MPVLPHAGRARRDGAAAPAATWRGLWRREGPRADTRDRPPDRWGHLSRAADAAGVDARCGRPPRREWRPGGHSHALLGPRDEDPDAPVYYPRRVAGSVGDLHAPHLGSGAAHRGAARAPTHTDAHTPGSSGRTAGGAPLPGGALYGGAPPKVTPTSRTGGRLGARGPVRAAWPMRARARAGAPRAWGARPCLRSSRSSTCPRLSE